MYLAPNPYMNGFDPTRLDMVLEISQDRWERNLASLSASVSKLDLKAPNADEAPNSPSAVAARQMIDQITDLQNHPPPPSSVEIAYSAAPLDPNSTSVGIPTAAQKVLRQFKQQRQLAEVESVCESCPEANSCSKAN
jgi:hypothetical protein